MQEMQAIVNEMAQQIAESYDWQALKSVLIVTGDGTAESFDLPSDFDRIEEDANLRSTWTIGTLFQVQSTDEWLRDEIQDFGAIANKWIIYGDQMHFRPAPPNDGEAKCFYIRNTIVKDTDDSPKASFTADTDNFVLSERLLKLGIIWRWKAHKSLDYAEELADFEAAKERLILRDAGPKMIKVGRLRVSGAAKTAYPRSITP